MTGDFSNPTRSKGLDESYGEPLERAIGKYRLIATLGEGGMGSAYLGVLKGGAGFHKLLVLKVVRGVLLSDPDIARMFLQEARIAARLNHPNIVQTVEVGSDAEARFIVMEYLDGQPVSRIVSECAKLGTNIPLALHVRILLETLAGLHYAHELTDFDGSPLQIVHRDVSPHNVFVTYEGQVKLIDFGIAKTAFDESRTATGVLKGKLGYMAPEQIVGIDVDRRADIYGVGVMLWEAITGKRMRRSGSDLASMNAIMAANVISPRSINESCPPELERICLKALARDREERFATALEFQTALEEFMHESRMRASMRELGAMVADQFADQRAELRTKIESRIRRTVPPDSLQNEATIVGVPDSKPSSTRFSIVSTVPDPAAFQIKARTLRFGLIATIGIVLASGIGVWVRVARRAPTALAPISSTEAVPTKSASPALGTPELVKVTVIAKPENATISIDGTPFDRNPGEREFERDTTLRHFVHVEAPDFISETREVSLDHSQTLSLVLSKAPSTSKSRSPQPIAPTAPRNTKVDASPKADPTPKADPAPSTRARVEPPPTGPTSNVRKLDPQLPW